LATHFRCTVGHRPAVEQTDRPGVGGDAHLAGVLERDLADQHHLAQMIEGRVGEQRSDVGGAATGRLRGDGGGDQEGEKPDPFHSYMIFFCAARARIVASATNRSAPAIIPDGPSCRKGISPVTLSASWMMFRPNRIA